MIRGIERRKIFLNQKDCEDFIQRLAMLLPAMKTACYAWVLQPNHAHFLFHTGTVPLARLMGKGKGPQRSLLWAVREAGIPLRTMARRLGISSPAVGYVVERGEAIARENHYELLR